MTNQDLANFIFPDIHETIADIKAKYPARNMQEGSCVTRFAPSPTGFIHIGNFFSALIDYVIAKNTNGIFYLRNEDTDQKREVPGATEKIMETLKYYDMIPDEYEFQNTTVGNYGPYIQSKRKAIYQVFMKHLLEIGRAYPCFSTKEELDLMRENQERAKVRTGYYGRYAQYRNITPEEAIKRIQNGESYVLRFKSMGNFDTKFKFIDQVRGLLFLPQNDQDIPIMKSDNGLPTYHFAHVVDDYLMQTTDVVRGEEWLSSVPLHIELFEAFGFTPPRYIHVPLILKQDGDIKRKISKRKDPEASMSYYEEIGYPQIAVIEALMTIANSNYEQWHTENPNLKYTDFPFSAKKMSATGGALFDLEKLNNISKDMISKMSKEEVAELSYLWACQYDPKLKERIESNRSYYENILNIEREQPKPRKDIVYWSDIMQQIWYMYDDLFAENDQPYEFQKIQDQQEIKHICTMYLNQYYQATDDKETWFQKIKSLADSLGYASNMKEYKQHPENYKGNVADISTVLRVALTKKAQTPDLYEIMQLLGKDRIQSRFDRL